MQLASTPPPAPTSAPDPTTAVDLLGVIGTWFGGIATAAAVGVALWISHRDWRRADAERRDQEKMQARLIWADFGEPIADEMKVFNSSAAPVFEVTGKLLGRYQSGARQGTLHVRPARVLNSGDQLRLKTELDIAELPEGKSINFAAQPTDVRLVVQFVDAAGRRWKEWTTVNRSGLSRSDATAAVAV
jgi:hypothetical protein